MCTSIIISVTLTICCILNQNETLSQIDGHRYLNGAVASDQKYCSEIGVEILKENGSAVDAAIASSFCCGVVNMHSSGIGGGGIMLIHTPNPLGANAETPGFSTTVYDYREVAPRKLELIINTTDPKLLVMGGLSIAVPGEVAGLYAAWMSHGKLPWKRLVEPSIRLTKEGIPLHSRLWEAARFMKDFIITDPGLRDLLFINGSVRRKDSFIKNPQLTATLEEISDDPMSFYRGRLAKEVVRDVQSAGGVLALDDLQAYMVKSRNAVKHKLNCGLTILSAPPPFSGAIVEFILNILDGYNFTRKDFNSDETSANTYHRIIEAMKFGFAKRTLLGDPDFMDPTFMNELIFNLTNKAYGEETRKRIPEKSQNTTYYDPTFFLPEDKGTSHISVYAPDGTGVSITNSINIWFGSGHRSLKTGIIYNNHIDDFSIENRTNSYRLKGSPNNEIKTNKRPVSSMSPTIVTDNGQLRMILGGSGGTRIITSVASVLMFKLWFNDTLGEAVLHPRVHDQLTPNKVVIEKHFPVKPKVVELLKTKYGHKIGYTSIPEYSSVQAIYLKDPYIYAKSDPRKYGKEAGY